MVTTRNRGSATPASDTPRRSTRRTRAARKDSDASPLSAGLPDKVPRSNKKQAVRKPASDGEQDPGAGIYARIRRRDQSISRIASPTTQSTEEDPAMERIRLAIAMREEGRALTHSRANLDAPSNPPPTATTSPADAASQVAPSSPVGSPHTPSVATPQSAKTFLGRMFSSLSSSFWASPVPNPSLQTPVAPTAPPVLGDLAMTLTPTPTPVGESRGKSRAKRPNPRRAILKHVTQSVNDPDERVKAEQWAEGVVAQLFNDPATLGEKRKRLEDGIKYGDLNHYEKPWASGYGLDDELWDRMDETPDEYAPGWAVLEHLRKEEEDKNRPWAKRQKASHNVTSQVTPLNEMAEPPAPALFDSKGRSASLLDLHPRSCVEPSPRSIFYLNEETDDLNGNVFKRSKDRSPPQKSAAELYAEAQKELSRNGHSEIFPGSFCVPDGSDDEDEESADERTASSLWTQQPPPAPVMSHASLPNSVDHTPSIPPTQGNLMDKTLDPIRAQRANIMKHTPHKPSRLREVYQPSPSLRSDAGNEPTIVDHSDFADTYGSEMPDAQPLEVPTDTKAYYEAYAQVSATAVEWDDPMIEFDHDFLEDDSDLDEIDL